MGMAWRNSMRIGVNGGISDITVASIPLGWRSTVTSMNMGMRQGMRSTMARFCASCGVLQQAPSAAAKAHSMTTSASR